jgi:putative two-component system hydrogenase maturation factor HypX/HoxX
MTPARSPHRVLFLVSAHSLSQRAYIAVTERGHDVDVAEVDSAAEMEAAVRRHRPDLIVCPMLGVSSPSRSGHAIAAS